MVSCRDFCIQKGERLVMVLPVVGVMTKNLGKLSLIHLTFKIGSSNFNLKWIPVKRAFT